MKAAEYRYLIERTYSEVLDVNDWLLSDNQFLQFVSMAKTAGSGKLVLENWKIYLNGGGDPADFFDWWDQYRPDKLEGDSDKIQDKEEVTKKVDGKSSPFDAVKKNVGMGGIG